MAMQGTTFQTCLSRVKAGEVPEAVAAELLHELTKDETLWLLDGDEEFWPGLQSMLTTGYNVSPYIHGKIDRVGIPGIRFTDGPRGVVVTEGGTTFPVSTARGATWDIELEEKIGLAIGREGRSQGCNFFGGVCVNLPRHPAWGRVQESYSEDPILLGEFGVALTKGIQRNMIACVKHYALNSIENSRFQADILVDDSALHEVYLPHFRRVIESGCMSVMSAYNSVNGEWAGQNKLLLKDILREQWGFKGFVMSDFLLGLRDPVLSVKNGLDIEACFRQQRAATLAKALESGSLSIDEVRTAALRILATTLRMEADREAEPGKSVWLCKEHIDLAREAATKSIVLLKNEQVNSRNLLPLDINTTSHVAVIGRLANLPNTGDHGSSSIRNTEITASPYEGIRKALPHAKVILEDSHKVDEAVKVASKADVAVLVMGYDHNDEGEAMIPSLKDHPELASIFPPRDDSDDCKFAADFLKHGSAEILGGGDRKSIRLPPKDVEIIRAVSKVNQKIVVVIITAGAVITEEWRHQVPAVVLGWYNGCQSGHALADVLLGHTDASGRLPYSIPTSEEHLPFFESDTTRITYDKWFGQRMLDRKGVTAAFPLGFGLSYTTFSFSNLKVDKASVGSLSVSLQVTNTGSRAGRHVVQIYGKTSAHDFPSRVLLGFLPVELEAGESRNVDVSASIRPLERWENGQFVLANPDVEIEASSYCGDYLSRSVHYRL